MNGSNVAACTGDAPGTVMRVVVELGLASSVFVLSECSPPNRLGSSCSNCCHGRNRAPTAEATAW
ncbi:Uncharacterised protein [Mycobacterium tuberculosis]|nr:Uncharacterised protein [Mycobacterium tuberculosis]CKU73825.1 Uncharacterised protein [Mycobacterium tuberculosis]COX21298.1 Uncharacterised protein [Mycobacterium tuberculosis]COY22267.1 Uncharacterised protein [Mycobacterium tuberculosis]